MNIHAIPRYTLPARLVCLDLLSRIDDGSENSSEMRHAVAVISSYLLEPDIIIDELELEESITHVMRLYKTSGLE
jgi:hypothetical protein